MTHFRNTIVHADCTQFLPGLPSESVDFILTDPPYLVSYKPRDGRTVSNDSNDTWLKPAFAEMYRVLAARRLLPDVLRMASRGQVHAGLQGCRVSPGRSLRLSEAVCLLGRPCALPA